MSNLKKKTEEVLISMLTECTGRNMFDSGDYYGRGWERNQYRNFREEPEEVTVFEVREGKLEITTAHRSSYHALIGAISFDEEADEDYRRFTRDSEKSHPQDLLDFSRARSLECTSLYFSYSDEFAHFSDDFSASSLTPKGKILSDFYCREGEIMALSFHLGCDIRSGWGTPRLFRLTEVDVLFYAGKICPPAADGVFGDYLENIYEVEGHPATESREEWARSDNLCLLTPSGELVAPRGGWTSQY